MTLRRKSVSSPFRRRYLSRSNYWIFYYKTHSLLSNFQWVPLTIGLWALIGVMLLERNALGEFSNSVGVPLKNVFWLKISSKDILDWLTGPTILLVGFIFSYFGITLTRFSFLSFSFSLSNASLRFSNLSTIYKASFFYEMRWFLSIAHLAFSCSYLSTIPPFACSDSLVLCSSSYNFPRICSFSSLYDWVISRMLCSFSYFNTSNSS